MRQAQESEIIRLSMHIREGKPLNSFAAAGKQVQIITPAQVTSGMYDWADQILCATNQNRNSINSAVRTIHGRGAEPEIGDRIISLRNEWEFLSSDGTETPLTNGTIGKILDYDFDNIKVPKYIISKPIPFMFTSIEGDMGERFFGIPIDYNSLVNGEKTLDGKQEYKMVKNKNCIDPPFEFSYAYAITVWKAQGSEWDKVLGIEEKFPFDKETHTKYLYTLATRAREKLVMVTK